MAAFADFLGSFARMGMLNATLCYSVCATVLLGKLGKDAESVAWLVAQAVILSAVNIAIAFARYLFNGRIVGGALFSIFTTGVTMALFALAFSKLSWQSKLVRSTTFIAVYQLLSGMVGSLGPAFGSFASIIGMRSNIVLDVVCVVYVVFILRFSTEGFRFIPTSYVILICVIDALAIFLVVSSMMLGEPSEFGAAFGLYNFEVNVVLLSIVTIAYALFYSTAREHAARADALLLRKTEADNEDQLLVARDVYESLREARHEIKNHDAYMRSMLDAGDYEGLRAYFDSYEHQHKGLATYVQSGHRTVDAVVNAEIAKARARGVELKTVLAVPSHLGYEGSDLYSLLANLLDNAIEGTVASGAAEKVVRLSIMPKGGYYIINVSNPVNPQHVKAGSYSTLVTTKRDAAVHGWGTKVVAKIAQKYGGAVNYTVADGRFVANVMLVRRDVK